MFIMFCGRIASLALPESSADSLKCTKMSSKNSSSKPIIDLVSSCEEEDDGNFDVDVIELISDDEGDKKPAATATTTTAQRNKKKARKTRASRFNNTDKSKRTIIDLFSSSCGEEDDDGIFDVDVIELVSDDDADDGDKKPAADLRQQW